MEIEKLKSVGDIIKIEDSKQQSTGLILTTSKGMKIFEWVPKNRWKDIHRKPNGFSDEEIKSVWSNSKENISPKLSINNLLTKNNVSIDVLELKGTYISVDGEPKYYFFGCATKSSVGYNTKKNVVTIKYTHNRLKHHYTLNLSNGEMERVGKL